MRSDDQNKCCANCKYFEQHYGWKNGGFYAVNCGHCTNTFKAINTKVSYSEFCVCKFWEDGEEKNLKRREEIVSALKNMCERIEEIADALGGNL